MPDQDALTIERVREIAALDEVPSDHWCLPAYRNEHRALARQVLALTERNAALVALCQEAIERGCRCSPGNTEPACDALRARLAALTGGA